jgi:adenine-specific DNA-methyltransferase
MRSLFADPEQEYNEAVQFYKHDVDWSNRLILGDSLAGHVVAGPARRSRGQGADDLYSTRPTGSDSAAISSRRLGKREVKGQRDADLTREPEMVKAYRDTWTLGVHSYLSIPAGAPRRGEVSYLADSRAASSSRSVTKTFTACGMSRTRYSGRDNFISLITLRKTTSATNLFLPGVSDYLLWYARNRVQARYRAVYLEKGLGGGAEHYGGVEFRNGMRRTLSKDERADASLTDEARLFTADNLQSASMGREKGEGAACWFPVSVSGRSFLPNQRNRWKTNESGMLRLFGAERVLPQDEALRYLRYIDDFPVYPLNNVWADIGGAPDRRYIVETTTKIVERCILMTTDPGDLVLDPTCGSGTTASVAEQWGRRWIAIDTSRVAVAIARQRLLTSRYDFFKLKDASNGVVSGFRYRGVPHISLKSIAQNPNLDPVFARHEPILEEKLGSVNAALAGVSTRLRTDFRSKLALKQKQEGKKAITDADRRRWDLPPIATPWQHWEVPFDTDPDYPADLKKAVEEYRAAHRAKMDEVNACIAANADREELVDQPEIDRKITRVSGPFTVEAVQPPEMSLGDATIVETGFAGEPDELGETFAVREVQIGDTPQNLEAYLSKMVDLLRMDGVRFPNNKEEKFTRLDAIYASGSSAGVHAEGRWVNAGETDPDPDGAATVGVVFGPQYGPITAKMIEEVTRPAARRYDDLVFAGFSFDGPAQAVIDEGRARVCICTSRTFGPT